MADALSEFLAAQHHVDLLRLVTCGSVDDGKSTLIGRLLYDAGVILEDHLAQLRRDSQRYGTAGAGIDFALLLDGLDAERTQGITIDVAYRYFSTPRRRFTIVDAPGHAQYTRNMATGAANADIAVLLVDARSGIATQSRRHAFIASLLGIRSVVLAVNKMDLVDFKQQRFEEIRAAFKQMTAPLGFEEAVAIPLCATAGDNVVRASERMAWYAGPTLLRHLETVRIDRATGGPFRMPVQWVSRTDASFRGYSGTVASGQVRVGDQLHVTGSDVAATVAGIVTFDGDGAQAGPNEPITLVMRPDRDISRGDVLAAAPVPRFTDRFDADLIWLADAPLIPGRGHLVRLGTATVPGSVIRILYRVDIAHWERVPADILAGNEVAHVSIALAAKLAVEPFDISADLGGFVLIDRVTNATVAVGMVRMIAEPAGGAIWQSHAVDPAARAALKGQRPVAVWFTGLSGAGKSTIANLVEQKLHALGRHTALLDGDNVRHGLNRDLGFSEADRVENIRRAAEVARLMVDAGLIVLVSFISPYRADRAAARGRFDDGMFIEVFVDTPVEECRRRDPKGLYRRADAGELRNFTGVDAPYETPEQPELSLRTETASAVALAERVVDELERRGIIPTGAKRDPS